MKWLEVGLKPFVGWTKCVRWKSWVPHITIRYKRRLITIGLYIESAEVIPGMEKCRE